MEVTKGDVLGELRAALGEQGRADAESCTLLTAAATLRPPGKAFLLPGLASAFRSACLGPLFARYAVQKGRPVELQGGIFDCSKLGRYHFHVDPAIVPSANNHPFQDWLDKLRDFTGTHSLSPAPLVPWPVYSGTMLHSLSCCLVGLEMYWKVCLKKKAVIRSLAFTMRSEQLQAANARALWPLALTSRVFEADPLLR